MPLLRRLRFWLWPLAGLTLVASTMLGALAMPTGTAREMVVGPVPAEVVRVIDGDTVEVRAKIWLGQELTTRVRLAGIDAPELHGACAQERHMALAARDFLAGRLPGGATVYLHDIVIDKFGGRVVARLQRAAAKADAPPAWAARLSGGEDLSDTLLHAGFARPYDGGPKAPWCR